MTDVKVSVPPTQQNNCAHFKSCAFVGTRCRYTAYSDYTADWQPKNRFLFPAGQEICPFTKTSRPGFETHVASYSISAGGSFLGVKATSVWSRLLHLVPRLGMIGALPHMLSYSAKWQLRFLLVGYVKQYISAFFVARLSTDEIFPSVQELQRFRRNSTRRDVWIQNNTTELQLGNLVESGLQYYDICKTSTYCVTAAF